MSYKQLKIFAMVCMLFDHVTRIFPLHHTLLPLAIWAETLHPTLGIWILEGLTLYLAFIGRLAAPIFLFCIAEGFFHTRNIQRYLCRILVTAVIAQVPYVWFDLAESRLYGLTSRWQDVGGNILFTLALGLAAITLYHRLTQREHCLTGLLVVAAAAILAQLLGIEGGRGYILLIFVFYLTRNRPRWQRALFFAPAVMLSRWGLMHWALTELSRGAVTNCVINVFGNYLGMLATLFYTGEKGRMGRKLQLALYAFYPAHFAALALIAYLLPPLL